MAAMSVPVAQEGSGGNLADMVSSLQQQVQSDRGSPGDIDALGKGGGKGKKGGGKGGNGVGGGSGKGVSRGINGSCWWCGVFGYRQSECPASDARNGQRDADKGGKSKGGSKGLKGSGKGGKGKGLYEVGWSGDFNAQAGWDGCSECHTAGTWTGASACCRAGKGGELAVDQPALGQTAQSASGTWAFGVKSLGALALCHKARTLCHRNRFTALEKEEGADDSRELPSNEDFPELVGSQMLASCQHCWEPSCGKKAVAGFEPRPRPKRRKTHWTKFADTDVNKDGAETQERTSGVLLPLWKPSQGTSLCPLKRTTESMVGGRRKNA